MSKIAEQKALEAYPSTDRDPNGIFVQVRREDYVKGYDQAMKDFLEKACKWFKSNLIDKEIVFMGIWHKFTDKDIEQFKNHMQDE